MVFMARHAPRLAVKIVSTIYAVISREAVQMVVNVDGLEKHATPHVLKLALVMFAT